MYPLFLNYQAHSKNLQGLAIIGCLLFLTACDSFNKKPVAVETEPVAPPPVVVKYSAEPKKKASETQIKFAQTALKKLGYEKVLIDGLWGPRSATAIRLFETNRGIVSANGFLSELNLHELETVTSLSLSSFSKPKKTLASGINAKLSETAPLSSGPQLIIVEREYTVLSKPNPYSSAILTLSPGTGIYVLAKQDGWFEIESLDRQRGYLPID